MSIIVGDETILPTLVHITYDVKLPSRHNKVTPAQFLLDIVFWLPGNYSMYALCGTYP